MYHPLHTEEMRGVPVRFFESPPFRERGAPDHPWHAYHDLAQALQLSPYMTKHFLRALQGGYPGEIKTVSTPDGIVTICPHHMAQGLMGALADVRKGLRRSEKHLVLPRQERQIVERRYRQGMIIALAKMTPAMSPEQRLHIVINAVRADRRLEPLTMETS